MATKEFITLEGLSTFKTLITQYIDSADADSIKSLSVSGNTVNFYKNTTATGTPAYTVNIPDVSGFMSKIANASGGKIVTSTASGEVSESEVAVSDLMPIGDWTPYESDGVPLISDNGTLSGSMPIGNDGLLTGYFGEAGPGTILCIDYSADTRMVGTTGLTADDLVLKGGSESWDGDNVAITNYDGTISESEYSIGARTHEGGYKSLLTGYYTDGTEDGLILVTGSDASSDIGDVVPSGISINDIATTTDLADKIDKISSPTGGKIATTTAQGGVAESNTAISDLATNAFVGSIPQGATATTVIGYVDEAVAEAEDDSEITLVEAQTPTTGYLKTYELYQGGNAAANLVGKIDIPKDLVVTSGEIVVDPAGQPAGTYLKLTIANQTAPVYINVADLADVYTAQQSAAQVQLAISSTNEISATIVAGSVTATELASNAVTTAKIADDAVTADKVAISAHTESKTAGADGLAFSVTTTDGQVSAVTGSIASGTYASAAQGALADTALQPEDVGEVSTSDIEALFS